MSLTDKEVVRLKGAICRLVSAEVADSWKGGSMPEHWPAVETELKNARNSLNGIFKRLLLEGAPAPVMKKRPPRAARAEAAYQGDAPMI